MPAHMGIGLPKAALDRLSVPSLLQVRQQADISRVLYFNLSCVPCGDLQGDFRASGGFDLVHFHLIFEEFCPGVQPLGCSLFLILRSIHTPGISTFLSDEVY